MQKWPTCNSVCAEIFCLKTTKIKLDFIGKTEFNISGWKSVICHIQCQFFLLLTGKFMGLEVFVSSAYHCYHHWWLILVSDNTSSRFQPKKLSWVTYQRQKNPLEHGFVGKSTRNSTILAVTLLFASGFARYWAQTTRMNEPRAGIPRTRVHHQRVLLLLFCVAVILWNFESEWTGQMALRKRKKATD